jgi:hypothetical protein
MRQFIVAVLAAAALLGIGSTGGAQAQYAKLMIGKWEGDIQMARGRSSPDRTLIIESVGEGEGPVPVKGQYGITGQKLGRMQGTLETAGGQALLRFTTGAGSNVVLRLHGERDLIGTIDFPGTSQRAQDHPMRLKKME